MGKQKVAIVCDSTCDIPDELIEELGISLAPVHIIAGDVSYRDRLDITTPQANEMMLEGKVKLTTSGAAGEDWMAAFEKALTLGESLVVISLSPALSGTYQTAVNAKSLLDDEDITLIESKSVIAPEGLVAIEAARAAKAGAGRDEVAGLVRRLLENVRMVVTSPHRGFARAGGRYRSEAGAASEESQPIFRIWEKGWVEIDRAPSRKEAIERLHEWMKRDLEEIGWRPGRPLKAAVEQIVCPQDAEAIAARIRQTYQPREFHLWDMDPTAGIHLGPGTVGMAYLHDPNW